MSFLNNLGFWTKFWTIYFFAGVAILIIADVTALLKGEHNRMGDQFTFTHWLVAHVGLSILGAFIGYLVTHFLIVHRSG